MYYLNNYGNEKRTKKESQSLLNEILITDHWIIEDQARDVFKEGLGKADIIIYLEVSYEERKRRIRKRYDDQKENVDNFTSYIIDDELLKKMYKSCDKFEKEKMLMTDKLLIHQEKLVIINEHEDALEVLKCFME